MSKEELIWLAEQASKCKLIVEIGSHNGRSTAAIADNCKGSVLAIDLWGSAPVMHEFVKNAARNVISHRGDSLSAAEMIKPNLLVDFIFIDADHSYEAVKADIAAWSKRLAPGGTIAGHDYDAHWPGVMRAVDEAYPGRLRGAGSIWYYTEKPFNEKLDPAAKIGAPCPNCCCPVMSCVCNRPFVPGVDRPTDLKREVSAPKCAECGATNGHVRDCIGRMDV
jgi:hypothetical protein